MNDEQLEAAEHDGGPLIIAAGAGTGKTRTLTARVARLLESGVPPERLMLLTFTRRAAAAMTSRAAVLSSDSLSLRVILEKLDSTGVTINAEHLTMLCPPGYGAGPHDCRDAIFPGYNRAVTQDSAHVCYQSRCMGKQGCPGRIGHGTDEDRTGYHPVELGR